jgi:hypothetical protein
MLQGGGYEKESNNKKDLREIEAKKSSEENYDHS